MEGSIVIVDSSDDENNGNKEEAKLQTAHSGKRQNEIVSENEATPAKQRRIIPIKIGEIQPPKQETSSQENTSDVQSKESDLSTTSSAITSSVSSESQATKENGDNTEKEKRKNEITRELEGLINACRKAENNSDMKKIIKTKLIKYYDLVHPEYAQSKHLRKMFEDTALSILRDPKTVYSKLEDVINELKSRKNSVIIVPVEEAASETATEENGVEIKATGDEKKDSRLRKLNKALTKLKKAIEDLEEAEVNLDEEEDSAYLKKTRYEKRAVEIYNKICELTGESTHAHRIVKQPVKFKSTKYKEFNKRLSKKVNKENGFPSYYDVYRLLDYCNRTYGYGLFKEEVGNVSRSAFEKVGRLLQERRCNDLYESAEHYAGKNKDPAKGDGELKAKLEKNKEFYKKKTEEIIQLYVNKQQNGEEPVDSDVEMGEPSNASNETDISKQSTFTNESNDKEIQSLPTEKLMIDIKTECDINGDKKDAPVIDLAIAL